MHENRKEEEKEKKGENSVRLGNRTRPLIGDICASVFASSSCLVEFGSGSSHGLDFWLLFFFFFFFLARIGPGPLLVLVSLYCPSLRPVSVLEPCVLLPASLWLGKDVAWATLLIAAPRLPKRQARMDNVECYKA